MSLLNTVVLEEQLPFCGDFNTMFADDTSIFIQRKNIH